MTGNTAALALRFLSVNMGIHLCGGGCHLLRHKLMRSFTFAVAMHSTVSEAP